MRPTPLVLTNLLVSLLLATGAQAQETSEDLIRFDPSSARVQQIDGRWKVIVGQDIWLEDFGTCEASARKALEIIRTYRLDCLGYVGRPDPGMCYYLSQGHAPFGPMADEDAIPFDPRRVQAAVVQNSWKVVDGDHWMLDFGDHELEARQAVALIQKYGFNHICFVGRSSGCKPMMYFRAERRPDAPEPPAALPGTPPAGLGRLRVTVVEGDETIAKEPLVTVRAPETPSAAPGSLVGNPATFSLMPGTYEVVARVGAGQQTSPRTVHVAAGELAELRIHTGTGTLEARLTAAGKPLVPCPMIQLRSGEALIAGSTESPARFQASEGQYLLRVQLHSGQYYDFTGVSIAAGQTISRQFEVPSGGLTVTVAPREPRTAAPGLPYIRVDAGGKLVAALVDHPARFQLLAGTYDVYVLDGDRRLGQRQVTIQPGQHVEIELQP